MLSYRPCVGIALFNMEGQIWVGCRTDIEKPDLDQKSELYAWQMPQGGIDAGETPLEAAKRELYEETGVHSVVCLAEAVDWVSYDVPDPFMKEAWRGKYRGQTQKWFAFLFQGEDTEIDILNSDGAHAQPEFSAWRWAELVEVPGLVIPFKRQTYEYVAGEFTPLARKLKTQLCK